MKKTCMLVGISVFLFVNFASATIININSRSNSSANPVEIFLEAGTYKVEPIGIAGGGLYDSWIAWANTSCNNPNGCPRTSPTTVTGWLNDYEIISPYLTDVSVNGIDLAPTDTVTPFESYFLVTPKSTLYVATDGLAFPNPLSALSAALWSEFTLSDSAIVKFAITDNPNMLSDNRGGISLKIASTSEPIPEPVSMLLFGTGLVGFTGYLRKHYKLKKN